MIVKEEFTKLHAELSLVVFPVITTKNKCNPENIYLFQKSHVCFSTDIGLGLVLSVFILLK